MIANSLNAIGLVSSSGGNAIIQNPIIDIQMPSERNALVGLLPGQIVRTKGVILVSGAGTAEANGIYTERGEANGKPFYNKLGSLTTNPADDPSSCIFFGFGQWAIAGQHGDVFYSVDSESPDGTMWTFSQGALPAPTVTKSQLLERYKAPDETIVAVFMSGGTQGMICVVKTDESGKPGFELLGEYAGPTTNVDMAGFHWVDLGTGLRWNYQDGAGNGLSSTIYYSLSDVARPDLATDWRNASDDSPASITVTPITRGELEAGVTVSGAGTSEVNTSWLVNGNSQHRNKYSNPNFVSDYPIVATSISGNWSMMAETLDDEVSQGTFSTFPWQATWTITNGTPPAPTVTRNDVVNPNNWELLSQ
jgi:hypothetical protein